MKTISSRLCLGAALTVVAFVAYARLAPSTVAPDDCGEFQLLAWKFGISHGTGYPLYLLVGHLFTLLPGLEVAHAVTLASCAFAAGSVGLLYDLATRGAPDGWIPRIAAVTAAAVFGMGTGFVRIATEAEPYALQIFLTLLVFRLALRWARRPSGAGLAAAWLVAGAMSGNHITSLALYPALALYTALHARPRVFAWRVWAAAIGGAAVGVALFHLLPFAVAYEKHLSLDHWHTVILTQRERVGLSPEREPGFWECWWFTLRCKQFAYTSNVPTAAFVAGQLGLLPFRLAAIVGPLFVWLAPVGYVVAWRWWRETLALTIAASLGVAMTLASHGSQKQFLYLLAPGAVSALWVAVALRAGLEWAARWGRLAPARPLQAVVAVAACVTLLGIDASWRGVYAAWIRRGSADAGVDSRLADGFDRPRADEEAQRMARWAKTTAERLPPGAVLLSRWPEVYPVKYTALAVLNRPDIDVYEAIPGNPTGISSLSAHHLALLAAFAARPVFFTFDPHGLLPGGYAASRDQAGLWRVSRS